jgi:hypothetical protein
MVLTPIDGGGAGGKTITAFDTPFTEVEARIAKCFASLLPTTIYVPFDPETLQFVYIDRYKWKDYTAGEDRVRVSYSPNLYRALLKYYARREGEKLIIDKIPVLIVNYQAVTGGFWAGTERPADRPLDWQFSDWKQGYMLSRVKVPTPNCQSSEIKVTTCEEWDPRLGCLRLTTRTYSLAEGQWWVKYQARLLELPAGLLVADFDVIKLYYYKPKGVVYKIPGFSSIAEYLYKRKLNKTSVEQMNAVLKAFGVQVCADCSYTIGGRAYVGPAVVEHDDHYVVYLPVKRVGAMGLPAIPMWLIGLVIIAVMVSIVSVTLYKIESERQETLQLVISTVKSAQEQHTACYEACNSLPTEEEREKCRLACDKVYAEAINTSEGLFRGAAKTTFGELADLLKWGIAATVVLNVLQMMPRGGRD